LTLCSADLCISHSCTCKKEQAFSEGHAKNQVEVALEAEADSAKPVLENPQQEVVGKATVVCYADQIIPLRKNHQCGLDGRA
jgi:hypothetical protein